MCRWCFQSLKIPLVVHSTHRDIFPLIPQISSLTKSFPTDESDGMEYLSPASVPSVWDIVYQHAGYHLTCSYTACLWHFFLSLLLCSCPKPFPRQEQPYSSCLSWHVSATGISTVWPSFCLVSWAALSAFWPWHSPQGPAEDNHPQQSLEHRCSAQTSK